MYLYEQKNKTKNLAKKNHHPSIWFINVAQEQEKTAERKKLLLGLGEKKEEYTKYLEGKKHVILVCV